MFSPAGSARVARTGGLPATLVIHHGPIPVRPTEPLVVAAPTPRLGPFLASDSPFPTASGAPHPPDRRGRPGPRQPRKRRGLRRLDYAQSCRPRRLLSLAGSAQPPAWPVLHHDSMASIPDDAALAADRVLPARLFQLDRLGVGALAIGSPADLCLIDVDKKWTVDRLDGQSKSHNTKQKRVLYFKIATLKIN